MRNAIRYTAGALGMVTVVGIMNPLTVLASSNYAMQKKVVMAAGILTRTSNEMGTITRGEFAKMLVQASSYHDSIGTETGIALYADVAADHPYCNYIRVAAEKGWMIGYLGGNFKPDEPVKMLDAAKALMTLLGYTNDDFTGNVTMNRMTKFNAIGLNDDVGKGISDTLTWSDCVHLFYNLLDTNTKDNENKTKTSSTVYAQVLGYKLTDDGEINLLESLKSDLKGPYTLSDGEHISGIVPFSVSDASFYLNGEPSTKSQIEDAADDGVCLIYYNTKSKMVYAYSEEGTTGEDGETQMGAAHGNLDAIYYGSTDIMVPTSISLDGEIYYIDSSDMQFAFSVYGSLEIDDNISIVWKSETDSDGNEKKYVISYAD
ncbi:MAG: S-layer homology domain-containing protein [Bacillota bacterium]|nr:S-layer homology domain-containing protein [Bacillota bacterium]